MLTEGTESDAPLLLRNKGKQGLSYKLQLTNLCFRRGYVCGEPKQGCNRYILMRRSNDAFPSRPQHGWDTTSHDYHAHVARMERMPSVVTGLPRYPNVHKAFNNKFSYEEAEREVQNPEKKVQVSEYVETVEIGNDGSYVAREESVDVEAEGYIQQKHKGFELCKWKTFKAH